MEHTPTLARSVLDRPRRVQLLLAGQVEIDSPDVGLQLDPAARRALHCSFGGAVALPGGLGRSVTLRVGGGPGRDTALVLTGVLQESRRQTCTCCQESRVVVTVELQRVSLWSGERGLALDLDAFTDPALDLNPGLLRRNEDHVNLCHPDLVRLAVAARQGLWRDEVGAAQISELSPTGLALDWVTGDGGHREQLVFPHPARDAAELDQLLVQALGVVEAHPTDSTG